MDASLILTRAAGEGTAEGGGGGKAGHMPSDCRGRSQSIGRQASNAVRLAPSTMLRMVPLPAARRRIGAPCSCALGYYYG